MSFLDDVLAGLEARPRAIPARWFYDREGSELFEAIARLPEYYPTRTETAILEEAAAEIAERVGPGRTLFELGSGASTKTRILLDRIEPAVYVALDISGDFMREAALALSGEYRGLAVLGVEADFTQPFRLGDPAAQSPALAFFPGSTIGNLAPAAAVDLLRTLRSSLRRGEGDDIWEDASLLIGMDRVKDEATLVAAYDDAQGVTAAFNTNLLARINRELDGDVPLDAFRHRAFWNEDAARIEMHLEAVRDAAFTVGGRRFFVAAGETIHTENSHKYTPESARLLLRAGGWEPVRAWEDARGWFSVILAEARPVPSAP